MRKKTSHLQSDLDRVMLPSTTIIIAPYVRISCSETRFFNATPAFQTMHAGFHHRLGPTFNGRPPLTLVCDVLFLLLPTAFIGTYRPPWL